MKIEYNEDVLYIDIETVPYDEYIGDEDIKDKVPATYKKDDSISKFIEENKDSLVAKIIKERSIDRYSCRIICIAYAFGNDDVSYITGKEEEEIFKILNNAIISRTEETMGSETKFEIVGHNIKKFDAPILYLRSVKYGTRSVKDLFFYCRRTIEDTMEMGTYWLHNEYVSLKDLCAFFGRSAKEKMDGSMVYEYYKQGRLEEIAKYCCEDVEDCRWLHKKMKY